MRITILVLLITLFFMGLVFAVNKKTEDIQDPYVWDFGKVSQGDVLEHTFVLKNESRDILHIENISTSCGCTTSEIEKKDIPPGYNTEIKVKFDTKGYSGEKEKYVYVRTNQKNNPTIKLILKADIQPPLPDKN